MVQNLNSELWFAEICRNKNLGFVAEGLGNSIDWNKMLMQQRRNGSLFNSPATTAAALIHRHDDKCLEYLNSLLCEFKTWGTTYLHLKSSILLERTNKKYIYIYFDWTKKSIVFELKIHHSTFWSAKYLSHGCIHSSMSRRSPSRPGSRPVYSTRNRQYSTRDIRVFSFLFNIFLY